MSAVTRGQCSTRPTVTFPAAKYHRPLAGTKLYCLVTVYGGDTDAKYFPARLRPFAEPWTCPLTAHGVKVEQYLGNDHGGVEHHEQAHHQLDWATLQCFNRSPSTSVYTRTTTHTYHTPSLHHHGRSSLTRMWTAFSDRTYSAQRFFIFS